jgi:hypothetical protein
VKQKRQDQTHRSRYPCHPCLSSDIHLPLSAMQCLEKGNLGDHSSRSILNSISCSIIRFFGRVNSKFSRPYLFAALGSFKLKLDLERRRVIHSRIMKPPWSSAAVKLRSKLSVSIARTPVYFLTIAILVLENLASLPRQARASYPQPDMLHYPCHIRF